MLLLIASPMFSLSHFQPLPLAPHSSFTKALFDIYSIIIIINIENNENFHFNLLYFYVLYSAKWEKLDNIYFISFQFSMFIFFFPMYTKKISYFYHLYFYIEKKRATRNFFLAFLLFYFINFFFTVLYFFNDIAQSSENDFKLFPFIITVECRWYEVKSLHHKDLESLEYVCLWIRMHALDSH